MKITVTRAHLLEKCTIGKLFVDGGDFGIWTLEDVVRPPWIKVPGETAIPAGTYRVVVDYSQRFQRNMPHILDVPMFDGVRIHPGNTDADTEGCLLVGLEWSGVDFIGKSRDAFDLLFPKIQSADSVEIDIS